MSGNSTGRSSYWDNLKAVLIILVVLGHFLLPVQNIGRSVSTAMYWIYLFHMPAFIFVSGFFSKSFVRRGGGNTNKLIGFLALYFCFAMGLWLLGCLLKGSFGKPYPFSTRSAQWYLLCMFFWYLLIPHIAKLRPGSALALTVLIGLLMGTDNNAGSFLSLSRCIVFLPFFVGGYYFQDDWRHKIRPWMRPVSAGLFLAAAVILFLYGDELRPFLTIIYADGSYAYCSMSDTMGMLVRLLWYLLAALLTGALLCLIPDQKLPFTYIGERTLGIYIIHRLLRDIVSNLGFYHLTDNAKVMLGLCIAVSAVIVLLSSGKRTAALFNKPFEIDWVGENRRRDHE